MERDSIALCIGPRYGRELLRDPEKGLTREWLVTNGLGGYAFSTASGARTRRYHGLLVVPTGATPPGRRMVLLSDLECTVDAGGRQYALNTHLYPGTIYPHGYRWLESFARYPVPTWRYQLSDGQLERGLFMPHGLNAVVLMFTARGLPAGATLRVAPLLAYRDAHHLQRENGYVDGRVQAEPCGFSVCLYYGCPRLYFSASEMGWEPNGAWYRRFQYPEERRRGLDAEEDLYRPAILTLPLRENQPTALVVATWPLLAEGWERLREAELSRLAQVAAPLASMGEEATLLALAADQFLVQRGADELTIVAGYPWFGDWGRDTLIALPGLTLATGRPEQARHSLATVARQVNEGMVPNYLPDDGGSPTFNAVDASLWLFVAAYEYFQATRDTEFVRWTLLPVLTQIIECYREGTRWGIHEDDDGLISAGAPGMQLTWMDAKVGDRVVTPRAGRPVEVSALWYNALRVMAVLCDRLGPAGLAGRYARQAEYSARRFETLFWNEERGYLNDVLTDHGPDPALRPNQLLAVGLPFPLLRGERQRRVVGVACEQMLTPMGVRSLGPAEPGYQGRYAGGPAERDAVYHQGTAWPWLLGPLGRAYLRLQGYSPEAQARVRDWLSGLRGVLLETGTLPELADGDPPHRPGGCPAQAWSVGEVLRLWVETAMNKSAPFRHSE
ncbi:MAG: glycogen debranching enzyme N-terminal domain-containing protein [Armatimonadetes bacterium]|nr:glycogen debranching enzyme N-terminal domain-containing protein [Armatimonadota bacterium]